MHGHLGEIRKQLVNVGVSRCHKSAPLLLKLMILFSYHVTEFVVVVNVGIKNGPAWTRDNSPRATNENSIRTCDFRYRLRDLGPNNL